MSRKNVTRCGLVLTGLFAAVACGSHNQPGVSNLPAVAQAQGTFSRPPSTFQQLPSDTGAGFTLVGPGGFPAMTVTLTKSLISDDGYLIAAYARLYGVRTIFLPVAGQDVPNLLRRNPTTVDNLNALFATCTVYMVAGDETWLERPNFVPYTARTLSHRIGPMYPKFAGILYDIEPQEYPQWNSNRQGTIDRYFTLLDGLFDPKMSNAFRTTFVTTTPDFAREPNRSGGQSPTMLQEIEGYRAVDGTYLLMAGNSAAHQIERARQAFPQITKPYLAVADTAAHSGPNGYQGATPSYFSGNMIALALGAQRKNSRLLGVDVTSWNDLFTSVQAILPQPTPAPIPEPTGPLVPPHGTDYIGAYVDPNDATPGPALVAQFEAEVGRTLAYDIHYVHWDGQFPNEVEDDDVAHDRIPLISWHCGDSNAHIERGDDDKLIRAHADAIRAFGHPLFLRYEWEMNLSALTDVRKACYDPKTDLRTGFFSPPRYIAAWKRIRSIFAAEGANNVIWLWNPGAGGPDPAQYYPGDDEVDWVGLDSYDRHDYTFEDTFFPFLDDLSQFRKPMMIVETGAVAHFQKTFFEPSLETLKDRYPLVRGFSYLDAHSGTNWSLTRKGIAAFSKLAHTHFMSARQPH